MFSTGGKIDDDYSDLYSKEYQFRKIFWVCSSAKYHHMFDWIQKYGMVCESRMKKRERKVWYEHTMTVFWDTSKGWIYLVEVNVATFKMCTRPKTRRHATLFLKISHHKKANITKNMYFVILFFRWLPQPFEGQLPWPTHWAL